MNNENFNKPLSLRQVQVTDSFWKKEMELVRKEVIPYQWNALNDRIEDAAPSFCMHNFKSAAKMNKLRQEQPSEFREPVFTFRGIQTLPEDPKNLDDRFYGFVFQDSDFYKWIEAVGYSLTQHPDTELEKIADDAIDIVADAQLENGYLDTYYILNCKDEIFTNLRDNHELYCLGHLIEGAVAYYEATGKDKLLKVACRYADFVNSRFGEEEGKCKGYPGHEIAEMALVRLYETTNKPEYLKLAKFFIDKRGTSPIYFDTEHPQDVGKNPAASDHEYHQAHKPVREQEEAVGHAVRAVYLYSGMIDVARNTNDPKLFEACERLWDNIVNQKLYVTGAIGATTMGEAFSFNYDLPNDTVYAETCASIGLMFMARRMLEITPSVRYSDVMEQALYNTVLSGMALDGKSFFYVNPLEVVPKACHKDERKFHVRPVRQKWFGCACCPPNLARLISSISSYAYTEKEDILFFHLYLGSSLTKQVNGKTAHIEVRSDFPWNGNVEITADSCSEALTLALRIPAWCQKHTISLTQNGKETTLDLHSLDADMYLKDGYLYITRVWNKGDSVTLNFSMETRILHADGRVREDIGKVCVARGPIVYCLEEADNGKDLHLLTVDTGSKARLEDAVISAEACKAILLNGFRQELRKENTGLYYTGDAPAKKPVTLRFIPYYTWANRGENEMCVWVREN